LTVKPVMLPPGCARFAAKPLPIGSDTDVNTMGIVRASRARAPTTGVVTPKVALAASGHAHREHVVEQARLSGPALLEHDHLQNAVQDSAISKHQSLP